MDDLTLRETAVVESVDSDGTVLMHLIRPCVGKGRGRHLYEADMLERDAGNFVGWKMFVDHRDPAAQKAAGGLPRSIRDLGGRIIESWWDPDVPAEGRFGQGAVVGRAKPTPFVKSLIDHDPDLVEASINSNATGIKPTTKDGQRVLLVEGIQKKGSVDWVTEAGAGGKVVALMEAAAADSDESLLAGLTDDEFMAYVAETRPGLADALAEAAKSKGKADDDGDDDAECKALAAKLEKKGLPANMAMKAAKRQLAGSVKEAAEEEDDMPITPEALAEALADPECQAAFMPLVESAVEARMADERDLIRAEARADAERQVDLRDMRDAAHRMIVEAKLPDPLAASIAKEFQLIEGAPTPALDVTDEYDAEGKRTKTALAILTEAVTESITNGRELLAALDPTTIKNIPGSGTPDGEGDGKKPAGGDAAAKVGPKMAALLESAGFEDPASVYAIQS